MLTNKQANKQTKPENTPSKKISPHCGVRFLNVELGRAARQSSRCYWFHTSNTKTIVSTISAFTTTVWTEALHCLMFPNVTYVFVSFFLCLMIPWLVTVTKNLCLHDLCSAKLLSKQIWISRVVEFLIQIFMHKPVDKNINISHLNLVECAT